MERQTVVADQTTLYCSLVHVYFKSWITPACVYFSYASKYVLRLNKFIISV
jgi:hypothetical protein